MSVIICGTMQSSADIAQAILQDRAKGSSQLVAEYRERLYAVAFSLCRDAAEAEDLVFRTIERVLDRIETYQEQDSFYDWMCVILLNLYRDSRRGKTARGTVPVGGASEMEPIMPSVGADTIIAAVDADIARRALEKIPAQMREVLILHYFMDMSVRQIARTLLVPTGTVMSRLHYARIALAHRLGASLKKPAVALVATILFLLAGVAAVVAVENAKAKIRNEESDCASSVSESAARCDSRRGADIQSVFGASPSGIDEATGVLTSQTTNLSTPQEDNTMKRLSIIGSLRKLMNGMAAFAMMSLAANEALSEDGYIESDGNLCFNTGYYIGPNTKIELDYQLTEDAVGACILGTWLPQDSATDTVNPRCMLYIGANDGNKLSFSGSKADGTRQAFNLYPTDLGRHTVIIDYPASSGNFKILTGGAEVYNSGNMFSAFLNATAKYPLGIFARCDSAYATRQSTFTGGTKTKMKVFGLKIYEKENDGYILKKNFIPCIKGGVPGFKETCAGVFATGVRTDTVKCGGNIATEMDDPYIATTCNDVRSAAKAGERICLETGVYVKKNGRVELDFASLVPRTGSYAVNFNFMYGRSSSGQVMSLVGLSSKTDFRYAIGTKATDYVGGGGRSYLLFDDIYNVRRTMSMTSNELHIITAGFTNATMTVPAVNAITTDLTSYQLRIASSYGTQDFAPMKIYGLKVYEGANLVNEFRPFIENGVPGMIDVRNPSKKLFAATYGGGGRTNLVFDAGGNFACTDGSEEAYLEFDGSSGRIDTGIVITKDSVIEADFSLWNTRNLPGSGGQQVLLVQDGRDGVLAFLYINSEQKFSYIFKDFTDANAVNTGVAATNARKQFKFDGPNARMTIQCGETELYSAEMSGDRTRTSGSTTLKIGSPVACMRLYGFKVTTEGELVRNYVPCVRGGQAGLYDLCSDAFTPLAGAKVCGATQKGRTFQIAPQPMRIDHYGTDTLTCLAAGAQSYEWYVDGVKIADETSDSLTVDWTQKLPHVRTYSVRPVYTLFNEMVKGELAEARVEFVPLGTVIVFQ